MNFSDIGRALGVHYMTVSMWWDRYQAGGMDALAVQKRGPKTGAHRRLTTRQEHAIQRAITDTTPDQLTLLLDLTPVGRHLTYPDYGLGTEVDHDQEASTSCLFGCL